MEAFFSHIPEKNITLTQKSSAVINGILLPCAMILLALYL